MIFNQPNMIKPEHTAKWLESKAASRLMVLESGWLRHWVKQLRGQHLLYLGVDPNPKFLKSSRAVHRFRLGLPWSDSRAQVQALIEEDAWPLSDACVDVIVLQHAIDMSTQPHQLLREATRCLVPNGYLIIMGFNPHSLWGGWRWLHNLSSNLPWMMQPVANSRLQDWLLLLDMRVEQRFACGHVWPLSLGAERITRRVDRVMAGNAWIPANLNLVVARKTVAGMTAIRAARHPLLNNRFVLPVATAKQAHNE
ncbi:MAG: hypothetical protein RL217_857 [Pseudomonadota bacterium]|jgi:SAM-dependent methyltransferase